MYVLVELFQAQQPTAAEHLPCFYSLQNIFKGQNFCVNGTRSLKNAFFIHRIKHRTEFLGHTVFLLVYNNDREP